MQESGLAEFGMVEGAKCSWPRQHGIVTRDSFPWFILCTEPRSEAVVTARLRHGWPRPIPAYVPVEKHTVVRRRRVVKELKTMMPGYVLVRPNEEGDFHKARSAPGARKFLPMDDGWATLDPIFVDFLRNREEEMLAYMPESERKKWRAMPQEKRAAEMKIELGAQVRVKEGPFSAFFAKVLEIDEHRRINALLSIFGRPCKVWFDSPTMLQAI